ncbi:XRE family transcriptional regulator [Peptoniphilus sp. AGMB00490]|uniref:XRE family transcriptional regulator n=1 Tax=Peptoniphilus faecalis TaxID=2731255 RepID=A0A848RFS8_9FIRM|nr:XRE family transcriptional regulator [Peptoniphilus faecalis]NMW84253.1 XRE family transcriptional regulator [Peptoniphilus faecalis]
MTIRDLSLEEKISIAMKRKGYTYQKLAEEMEISVGYAFDIVKGNRNNSDRLEQIKKILEI